MNYQPRGKAQTYSLNEINSQWETLKHFHKRLVEISGVEENEQIDNFLDYLSDVLSEDSCPPQFLLNLTSTKAEVVQKTWNTLLLEAKKRASPSNYSYLVNKLRSMRNIDEVLNYIRKDFSDSEIAVEKNSKGGFKKIFGNTSN